MEPEYISLTVSAYLELINNTLATIQSDQILIVGEIAECRVSQGKWINFELKDEDADAKISCFTTIYKVATPLEAGMKVQVTGYPKIYERFGKFSLNVETVELVGEGALAKAYALLKKRLEEEGLFDLARKRSIPRFPKKIGLITSSEAAAYGDFLRILNNRWSGVEVMHVPVHVQGQYAVPDILKAFALLNRLPDEERPEVVVLTRGGGSLEDLHAFNDEQVARAVFTSKIPVVVGVGHERDESLCDFVSDIRASTPSNAAEIVVPDRRDIWREIDMSLHRMEGCINVEIDRKNRSLSHAKTILQTYVQRHIHLLKVSIDRFAYAFDRFRLGVIATRKEVERMERESARSFFHAFTSTKTETNSLIRIFMQFDVDRMLKRGFSVVRKKGEVVKDASRLAGGDAIQVQFSEGTVDATVHGNQEQATLL